MTEQEQEQISALREANIAYRNGFPILSDFIYDSEYDRIKELFPDNDFFKEVGISSEILDPTRKIKLPITMASMNKVKSIEELGDWFRLKNISLNEDLVLTPKFDGLSLCVDEKSDSATTRGDGIIGQNSNEHYKVIGNHLSKITDGITKIFDYTFGEVVISKTKFNQKYANDFANPRNLVAGLINNKSATEALKDCDYIKYGAVSLEHSDCFKTKSEILDQLNILQEVKVEYVITKFANLSEDYFVDLFRKWSTDYEIDGIIIEINDIELREKLGRERSTQNPVWARAYKSPQFEQSAITKIIGMTWKISKQGYLKPVVQIEPVKLDGVTVSNVTGNNARFVKDMGLGVGATVVVKRSGMVIPIITEVIEKVEFVMPEVTNIGWNENGVELVTLSVTREQEFKQLVSFFEILEVENAGEGVFKQLWDAGYTTVEQILNLKPVNMERLEGFGKRKAQIVYDAIQSKIKDVDLSKLQHATGIFKMLGSKKLALVNHFKTKPTIEQLIEIEGFAETSAQSYIDGFDKFNDFIKDLPITIKEKTDIKESNDYDGRVFVFTGVRDKSAEEVIEKRGGKIGSGVSSKTTDLIIKAKNSGSSKENKAIELGINILTLDELLIELKG